MVENRPVAPIFYGVARTKEDALLDIGRFNVLHVCRLGWRPRLPDQQYLHAQEKTALGMSNGHGVETPANKIATAQAVLVLAFRLNAEVLSGRIGPEIFKREVTVITGGTGVSVPAFSEGTSQDLQLGAFNLVLIAISASALTVDETLDEVFGKLSAEADINCLAIRVMVNQLRNAFAHNPWRPKWRVSPKYRNRYPIVLGDGSKFTFDATSLDGDGVKSEHVGGLEFWIKLLQHIERFVGGTV